jgi:hypothetical protein
VKVERVGGPFEDGGEFGDRQSARIGENINNLQAGRGGEDGQLLWGPDHVALGAGAHDEDCIIIIEI